MSDIQEQIKLAHKRAEENDIKLLKEEIEYEQYCNEQLRNKITNLEYKIKRLENELKGDNK